MIGRRLTADLEAAGNRVVRLVRDPGAVDDERSALWDPGRRQLDPKLLSGADAVVNLSGRNVGQGRWTARVKDALRTSRLQATETLVEAIGSVESPPRVLINASAVGYYGDRGEEQLDESSSPGEGFLAELSQAWETTAFGARSDSTRVVVLRFGMVVGRRGALARMVPAFKLGLGGPIGAGSQWWSWVAMADAIGVVEFILDHPTVTGALNVVSPRPTRCTDFARSLGRTLRRPALFPLPAPVARLALGEMADALLLASARVHPAALERLGYEFRIPDLEDAIRQSL
jgi:uncharacterized protein (TIGR01777 family)